MIFIYVLFRSTDFSLWYKRWFAGRGRIIVTGEFGCSSICWQCVTPFIQVCFFFFLDTFWSHCFAASCLFYFFRSLFDFFIFLSIFDIVCITLDFCIYFPVTFIWNHVSFLFFVSRYFYFYEFCCFLIVSFSWGSCVSL